MVLSVVFRRIHGIPPVRGRCPNSKTEIPNIDEKDIQKLDQLNDFSSESEMTKGESSGSKLDETNGSQFIHLRRITHRRIARKVRSSTEQFFIQPIEEIHHDLLLL